MPKEVYDFLPRKDSDSFWVVADEAWTIDLCCRHRLRDLVDTGMSGQGKWELEASCPRHADPGLAYVLPQHMDHRSVHVYIKARERTLMHPNLNFNFHFGTWM